MDVGVRMIGIRGRRGAMMVSAKRTIHDEGKRSDDRQSGRKMPDQRVYELCHPGTGSRRMHKTVIVSRGPVQSGSVNEEREPWVICDIR
jgi:hypothetical protein